MKWLLVVLCTVVLYHRSECGLVRTDDTGSVSIASLSRQVMLQQLYIEEMTRSNGVSGLKKIRLKKQGTKPYHASTFTGRSYAASHDHSNNIRVVGMGECVAVLNGVEFRTRHNDFPLRMPSTTSADYDAVEDIELPDVPPEVTDIDDVDDQIAEMREWFKAWKDQDYSVRDYRPYFKPVLCYLEGAWTSSGEEIDESFESDRHAIAATSWQELQEKVRFTSMTGRKDSGENYAYLPTTIVDVADDGTPVFAQWNYRILCHPLSKDLPLNRLQVVDDIASRLAYGRTMEEHAASRSARFRLNLFDTDNWGEGFTPSDKLTLLERLMAEIPGKDNYGANIEDNAFGETAYQIETDENDQNVPLNAGFYHHSYRNSKPGAQGLMTRYRGYNDENLFMAMNTQPKVVTAKVKNCVKRKCDTYAQKWSYAIPLEIIYLSPLYNWNPYKIEYKGNFKQDTAEWVTKDKRNGQRSDKRAYNGTHSKVFYRTPDAFFSGKVQGVDPADTAKSTVGVLNKYGDMKLVQASGTRILLPTIEGVGDLRMRYPIAPVHAEGEPGWKEIAALKDILSDLKKFSYLLKEDFNETN